MKFLKNNEKGGYENLTFNRHTEGKRRREKELLTCFTGCNKCIVGEKPKQNHEKLHRPTKEKQIVELTYCKKLPYKWL